MKLFEKFAANRKKNIDDVFDSENQEFADTRGGFTEKKIIKKPGFKAFILFLAALIVLMMGLVFWNLKHKKTETPQQDIALNNPLPPFKAKKPLPAPLVPDKPMPNNQIPAQTDPLSPFMDQPQLAHGKKEKQLTPEQVVMQRRLGHDFDASMRNNTTSTGNSKSNMERPKNETGALSERTKTGDADRVFASKFIHPDLTVAKGTVIPCGTLSEINTNQPGFISCIVSSDVYSASGKVVLINKGAIVDGEIEGKLRRGQNRVFVVWSRLRNPDNVIVNIGSPGTGTLGAAGLDGQVDTHFGERFGNAMLISLMSDAFQGAIQVLSNQTAKKQTSSINMNNTSQTSSELEQDILDNEMNIPPTLYKQQGSDVIIYVARDVDFSSVYDLRD